MTTKHGVAMKADDVERIARLVMVELLTRKSGLTYQEILDALRTQHGVEITRPQLGRIFRYIRDMQHDKFILHMRQASKNSRYSLTTKRSEIHSYVQRSAKQWGVVLLHLWRDMVAVQALHEGEDDPRITAAVNNLQCQLRYVYPLVMTSDHTTHRDDVQKLEIERDRCSLEWDPSILCGEMAMQIVDMPAIV
jgi:hypothetical protein